MLITPLAPPATSFRGLYMPKLATVLREGYGLAQLRADATSGLTVAILALPLSMAIAVASGASPERGLYTAIVGGFIISALGGSRFQVGGPAGAFIVAVAATIERHGLDGFLLATALAGAILIALGLLRLGTYIKYIPEPVTIGFTAGIGAVIFVSQLHDLFGLTLPGHEPAALLPKLEALASAAGTFNAAAAAVAALSLAAIVITKHLRPTWPAFLVAVVLASAVVSLLGLEVETIGTRFGGIPNSLPAPALPAMSTERVLAVLPDAFSLALLGGIESLLSAVVADSMTGRRHRSNCELVAQGIANIACAAFGGLCATGTIARTATNVRAGAIGPVSGMLHALFLLAFMLFAAPLASYIPLGALAAILALVAVSMADRHDFVATLRRSRGEAAILLVTFLLTVFVDLTTGILAGVVLGSFLFMHRMARLVAVETGTPLLDDDLADETGRAPFAGETGDLMVYRITGALFFGTSGTLAATLERIGRFPKVVILDLSGVPFIDASAAASLKDFIVRAGANGAAVTVAGAVPAVRALLLHDPAEPPTVRFTASLAEAREAAGGIARR